jgi:hypothetical protein
LSRIASVQRRENGRPVVGHVSGTVVRDVSIFNFFALASLLSQVRLQSPYLIGLLPALDPPLLELLAVLLIGPTPAIVPPLVPPLLELLAVLLIGTTPALFSLAGCPCRLERPLLFVRIQV